MRDTTFRLCFNVGMHPEDPPKYNQPVYTPLTDPANRRKHIAIGVLIVAFVLLIMVGVANVISSRNAPSKDYALLAARHDELLRIIDDHDDKARSLDVQNYIARANILLLTGQDEWIDFLAARYGSGISSEARLLAADTEIDAKLESSAIANRFDEDFLSLFGQKVDEAERLATNLRQTAKSQSNIEILDASIAVYESLEP